MSKQEAMLKSLSPVETFFSGRFQQTVTYHSAWLETGYNYLIALRDYRRDREQRRTAFVNALGRAARKAKITMNKELIDGVLERIKSEFKETVRSVKRNL